MGTTCRRCSEMPLIDSGTTCKSSRKFLWVRPWNRMFIFLRSPEVLQVDLSYHLRLSCGYLWMYLSPPQHKIQRFGRQRLSLNTLQYTASCLSQRSARTDSIVFMFLHSIVICQSVRGIDVLKQNPVQKVILINV